MKRTISSSVLNKKPKVEDQHRLDPAPEGNSEIGEPSSVEPSSGFKPRMGGSGSAWKAGALNDAQTMLHEKRSEIAQDILSGKYVLELTTTQVTDEIGTDRRQDWIDQEAFRSLYKSIDQNGQDTPIQVWPADPNWKPDLLEPDNVRDVPFILITGRRRHAIASKLGRTVRAVLASPEKRGGSDDQFEMLFMRFRENEERENLGAFERLLSVGQMFERYQQSNAGTKLTAVGFAKLIGVHESHVSRGKAIYKARDEILHACKNPYSLSHRELEKVVADLTVSPKAKRSIEEKPKKLTVIRQIGRRKLSVSTLAGKLSINAAGLNLDKQDLEGLGDVIANYLTEKEPKK